MSDIQSKAWTYKTTTGGFVKNLSLTDYPIPDFKQDHVLIEVFNASLNPGDYKIPDLPFGSCSGGNDDDQRNLYVAQIVLSIHRDPKTLGTLKTIMWVHRDSVYPLPENIPTEHGSGFDMGALTAYQAIVSYANSPSGKVLISGGSGGVGAFCIQVAKTLGLYAIATCSEAGPPLCKEHGADVTLDYKSPTLQDDLRKTQVDLVVDDVGYDPQFHRRSEGFLKPERQFVLVAIMDRDWAGIRSMLVSFFVPAWLGGPSRKRKAIFTRSQLGDYAAVAALAREGKLKVVADSVFSFEHMPKAFERLKSGQAKGKIIVDVSTHATKVNTKRS
ncbi:hypothetical protein DV736_g6252, partial [Chaetothyriales sp. CBS 134916]